MKRLEAKNVAIKHKEKNMVMRDASANMRSVGNKLVEGSDWTPDDMRKMGHILANEEGYGRNRLLVLEERFEYSLIPTGSQDISSHPLFIILCDEFNSKAVFALTKFAEKTYCLYKDFTTHSVVPEHVTFTLRKIFGDSIEFKANNKAGETTEGNQDVMIMKALQTMMVNLKSETKKKFIENFENNDDTYFAWVDGGAVSVATDLFDIVKDGYYETFVSEIDRLSEDTEFKAALKNFFDSIPSKELQSFREYQILLEKFVELDDQNPDENEVKILATQIGEARSKAFDEINLSPIVQNMTEDRKLEIERKFPKQIKMFMKIFEPLIKSQVDEKLEKSLQNISKKLDLDYEKLKSFFKRSEKPKYEKTDGGTYKNFEEIVKMLPDINPKSANLCDSERPFDQLLAEVKIFNSNVLSIEYLKNKYNEVKNMCKIWDPKSALEINEWAVMKKGKLSSSEIPEAIAVMDRTFELATGGFRFCDPQVLSILTFLLQTDKGLLSQIQTGEGKTTIVSVVAAIKALQGQSVDVITSNPVLASEGVMDKILFYGLLGLSASTNNLDEKYVSGERLCYKADIVYGSIARFQFDFLKDSFFGFTTRADRSFECVMLDEVDSMIVDNANHIAKLSEPLPGMDSLKYVYIKIWQELIKAEKFAVLEIKTQLEAFSKELETKTKHQGLLDDEAQSCYEKKKS